MPLTDKLAVVGQAIKDLLVDDWDGIGVATKADIYYGDQNRYPRTPAISVEMAPQDRELNQTGLQQRIYLRAYIMAIHSPIAEAEKRWKETDEFADKVVAQLHSDRTLGGIVIHSNVTGVEPGAIRRGGMLAVHRISWEALSNYTMPKS
jgi:hypothetical protein